MSQSLEISNAAGGRGLIEIVAQYAKVGLYVEALEISSSIKDKNFQAYALESIIQQIKM